MSTQAICLVLAIVLTSTFVSAQWVQTNGLNERQVPHHPSKGMNVGHETPRDLLGLPTQDRLPANLISRLDSLRASRLHLPPVDGKFIPNDIQRTPAPLRRIASPQSQIYVIDTAIVRELGRMGFPGIYYPGDTTRHLYSYNANAMRTCDLTQRQTGELWIDAERRTNTYDASNNMLSDVIDHLDDEKWRHQQRYLYTYDAHGNRLSELYETWGDDQWVESNRQTWTYDSHGNVLTWLNENWSNGQLVDSSSWRYTYTYDANGNMLTELDEYWSNGQWGISFRETCIYDLSSNLVQEIHEDWGGQWFKSWGVYHAYDASNNRVITIPFSWSSTNQQWEYWQYYAYTYDANNNMLTDSWYALERPLFDWEWVRRWCHFYAYDANSNLLSDSSVHYDAFWGKWKYTYDSDNNMTAASYDGGTNGNDVFRLVDRAGNSYDYYCHSCTFSSRILVTGVASQSGNVPAVYSLSQNYPNPFNPMTAISYQVATAGDVSLRVYDLLGREVAMLVYEHKNPGNYEVQFDGSKLASGAYIYRLEAGSFVQTKKLILLK